MFSHITTIFLWKTTISHGKQPFSYDKQQFSHEKEQFPYISIPYFGTDSPISTAPLRVAPRLQDATERRAVQDGRREALVAELRKAGPGGGRAVAGCGGEKWPVAQWNILIVY